MKNDFASNSFLESSRNHELYTAQRKLELDIRNQKVESDIFEQRKMLPIAAAK